MRARQLIGGLVVKVGSRMIDTATRARIDHARGSNQRRARVQTAMKEVIGI
jgi:F0F1-type ATP synthase delta subunit